MAMNMSGARGYGPSRISNNPSYRPYKKVPSQTQLQKKDKKMTEPSKSGEMKCQPGYIKYMGRCVSQEQRNKMNNVREAKNKTTVDKANKRFYSV